MKERYGKDGAIIGWIISFFLVIIAVIVYASSQAVATALENTLNPWEFFGIVAGGMLTFTAIGYGIGKLIEHFSSENSSCDQSHNTPLTSQSYATRVKPNTASVPTIQPDASHDDPHKPKREGCCVQ